MSEARTTRADLAAFVAGCQALQVATVDASGHPQIAHFPCAGTLDEGLVFLSSSLSPHHASLDGAASLLLLGEADANPFRHPRVVVNAELRRVTRDEAQWPTWLEPLRERFGGTVDLLAGLGDFCLIHARLIDGRWIRGFGDAWTFAGDEEPSHLDAERVKRGKP